MAKYLRKKKKKPVALIAAVVLVVVIVLAAFALFVMPRLLYQLSGGEDGEPVQTEPQSIQETDAPDAATEPAASSITMPLALDGGQLEINSLFPFSGINPDCDNQEGEDIAAILLKNTSDTYLSQANISLTLADGSQVHFAVTNLPAGKSTMAFSTENLPLPADAACTGAACDAVYDDTAVTESDRVSAAVSGVTVTLTNTSGEAIPEIVVYCRSTLGEDSFGGITYQYTVTDLPAGGSATVNATDCILGMAEVVRIAMN